MVFKMASSQNFEKWASWCPFFLWYPFFSNGPNTVWGSTVSDTELSEFFGAHWVLGSELSEFLSAYYLCAKANSPSFSQNSPSLPQNSVSSLLRNSTLETVFRPFPSFGVPPKSDFLSGALRHHESSGQSSWKSTNLWVAFRAPLQPCSSWSCG